MSDPTEQSAACCCTTLRKAARALTKGYDKALEETGLRVTQYALLSHISRMEPVPLHALAAAAALERTTLIRNLDVLRRQGFIHTAADSRAHAVTLTNAGRAALEAARPFWRKAQDRVLASFSNEERMVLDGLLGRLLRTFEQAG